jgi:hypothetical protein
MMNIIMSITLTIATTMAKFWNTPAFCMSPHSSGKATYYCFTIIPVLHMQALSFREVMWFFFQITQLTNEDLVSEFLNLSHFKVYIIDKNRETVNLGDSHPLQRSNKLLLGPIYLKIEQNIYFLCWSTWHR